MGVEVDAAGFRSVILPQFERETGDLTLEGQEQGDTLSGSLVTPSSDNVSRSGDRAHAPPHHTADLEYPMP